MNKRYSEDFRKLVSTKKKTEKILHGSFFKSDNFQKWEDGRVFISKAINQGGKIIDIGCSNGFLLRCFQEWTGHEFIPHGIDTEANLIEDAKKLFPKHKDNFIKASFHQMPNLVDNRLPKKFNIIYWNVWDNWDFTEEKYVDPARFLIKCLEKNGRLILGFYDAIEKNNRKRINQLRAKGINLSGQLKNPKGHEVMVWADKRQ